MILGIETSCDETSVALVQDGVVLACVTATQIAKHQIYGGVYPELASRLHVEALLPVLQEALLSANVTLSAIKAVAVTIGPGLIGSLHVGLAAAKTLALTLNVPLIPVNHICAHIAAAQIENKITYPALALVISGGHSELIQLTSPLDFELLGATKDDAIGEVFDKVARLLNLGYPGGPAIERVAKAGKAVFPLPFPKNDASLDFSFSGLKSAVLNLIHRLGDSATAQQADIAASFQQQAAYILRSKTARALNQGEYRTLILAGGVAANQMIRAALLELKSDLLNVVYPSLCYCGDNAAMIARHGEALLRASGTSPLDCEPDAGLAIKKREE